MAFQILLSVTNQCDYSTLSSVPNKTFNFPQPVNYFDSPKNNHMNQCQNMIVKTFSMFSLIFWWLIFLCSAPALWGWKPHWDWLNLWLPSQILYRIPVGMLTLQFQNNITTSIQEKHAGKVKMWLLTKIKIYNQGLSQSYMHIFYNILWVGWDLVCF